MNQNNSTVSQTAQTRVLCVNALFIALTFLATMCVNVRLPIMANGGLIHLGNVPLFLGAILFGKKTGAICGGVGMAMFDLVSGWTAWAPFTLVIVGVMGYVVGLIMENREKHVFVFYLLAMAMALVLKIVGYYIAESIIYNNWIAPVASIPGNVMQVILAAIVVLPMVSVLKKAMPARLIGGKL